MKKQTKARKQNLKQLLEENERLASDNEWLKASKDALRKGLAEARAHIEYLNTRMTGEREASIVREDITIDNREFGAPPGLHILYKRIGPHPDDPHLSLYTAEALVGQSALLTEKQAKIVSKMVYDLVMFIAANPYKKPRLNDAD